jgi:hypothetical protein
MKERIVTRGTPGCADYREAVARLPEASDVDAVVSGGQAPSCFGRLGLVTRVFAYEPGWRVHYYVALAADDTVGNGCGCSNSMVKNVLMRDVRLTGLLNSAECDALEEDMRAELAAKKGGQS